MKRIMQITIMLVFRQPCLLVRIVYVDIKPACINVKRAFTRYFVGGTVPVC